MSKQAYKEISSYIKHKDFYKEHVTMDKYSWDFDRNIENWRWSADTIEECLEQARGLDKKKEYDFIYIGKNAPYIPCVEAEDVLERIENDALDICGAAEDWNAFDTKKNEELAELSEKLSEITLNWLNKYGYTPPFCRVEEIKRYTLEGKQCQNKRTKLFSSEQKA